MKPKERANLNTRLHHAFKTPDGASLVVSETVRSDREAELREKNELLASAKRAYGNGMSDKLRSAIYEIAQLRATNRTMQEREEILLASAFEANNRATVAEAELARLGILI